MTFKAIYLKEQDLIFGGGNEEKDPKIGLKNFGPHTLEGESPSLEQIKLGIVGDKNSIEKGKEIIEKITNPIICTENNKWLYPHFPGLSKDTKFNCSVNLSKVWQSTILSEEIDKILEIVDSNERIGSVVELYLKKINEIMSEDNPPNVILCCIPKNIEEYCGISEKTRGAKRPKFTPIEKKIENMKKQNQSFLTDWGVNLKPEKKKHKGYDLRNALKGKLMSLRPTAPIQLLKESTIDAILNYDSSSKKTRQDPASFAWNLSTALFYKANGKPWRLAKLTQGTCYVGISFYRDKLSYSKDMQTSMAQIFTADGQGLVLRGSDVYIDEKTKEPHLSEQQAKDLLSQSIKRYTEKSGSTPSRVVIHKSTNYTSAEKKGFSEVISGIKKDFVTLTKNRGYKFMRVGAYPVLRGTLISLTRNKHLLYTSGYTPRIRTYPGHSIPQPILILHEGDSEIKDICDEILGLTKLNWNTTSFATYLPITLEFSNKVGEILSEADKESMLQPHYRFYM